MSSTIAHITAPAAFGGLERVVSGLTRALVRDHRVLLVTVLEPETPLPSWAEELDATGVVVVPVRVQPRRYGEERRQILEALRRHDVGIVHTHGYRPDVIAGGAARGAGYPVVSTVHGFTRHGLRNKAYEWLQVRSLRRHSAVVAVSQPLAAELTQRGVPRDRITVIANGMVIPLAEPLSREGARERLGLPPDARVVGWVGRFSHEKGADVMVRAARELRTPGAIVCFVGDGPMFAQCRTLAETLGIADRVRFAGPVPDAALLYRAFDAFALSSRTEGTPMALLEAVSAGVPAVATAVGGVPDVLGHGSESLVRSEDAAALAAAIDRSLADGAAASRRAAELLNRIRSAGEPDWIDRYRSVYRELVSSRERAGGGPTPHQKSSVR